MTVPEPGPILDSLVSKIAPLVPRCDELYASAGHRDLSADEREEFQGLRRKIIQITASHFGHYLWGIIVAGEWPEGLG
jgi:uncharacterized protein YnzC (UPF0291/DUF896 family)